MLFDLSEAMKKHGDTLHREDFRAEDNQIITDSRRGTRGAVHGEAYPETRRDR